MPTLADVTNFAVDSECLFTWDAVVSAEGYELRFGGVDWDNSQPLVGVDISVLSFQYTGQLDAVEVFIKAKADGYTESLNADSVTTSALLPIALVLNLAIVSDNLTFDLVANATSYEIRRSKGENIEAGDSTFISTVPDNTPFSITKNSGYRYYIRAHGPCNTKSDTFSSIFSPFNTNGCDTPPIHFLPSAYGPLQINRQRDDVSRSFGTTFADGKVWDNIVKINKTSDMELTWRIPCKNPSTAIGGGHLEMHISEDEGLSWTNLGSTGRVLSASSSGAPWEAPSGVLFVDNLDSENFKVKFVMKSGGGSNLEVNSGLEIPVGSPFFTTLMIKEYL